MEGSCQPSPQNPRLDSIINILIDHSPDTRPFLNYRTPFELLIAVILSAQCTDAKVNEVTPVLFRSFPDAPALAAAPPNLLQKILYPTGFFRAKALYVRATAQTIVETYQGEVPMGMNELTALPGVGRKTANVIRGQIGGLPAIIVDTHFKRVVRRLEITDETDPVKIEHHVASLIPPEKHYAFSMAANRHGRSVCGAREPLCSGCPVENLCPSAR